MEDNRIEALKSWPKPKSIRNIQVFLGFANFYWRFIQGFSKIVGSLTSMLQTTWSAKNSSLSVDVTEDAEVGVGSSGNCKDEMVESSPRSKNSNKTGYLTPEARLGFTQLRKAFTKAPILRHFDSEYYIRIETDTPKYAIGGMLSHLTDSGWWHLVAYYSRKMIPAKTRYKTHDGELLAIIEVFKTWHHHLKGCNYKVLVLTNYNNLRYFMDIKSLSFGQVWWAQELSHYHFQINYCQSKANRAADALLRFSHRNNDEEKKLWADKFFIGCRPH